jgi:hypothetical protein
LSELEQKQIFLHGELKAAHDAEEGVFEGYASTFGNIDAVDDIVSRGAFSESLKRREPKVLWQHDMQKPVGKLMDAREDDKGLYVKVKMALKTTLGRDAYEYMKADIINSLSIGFMVKDAEFDSKQGVRVIKEAELFEFSLVTIPANEMATITAMKSAPDNERDFERFLRNAGYSRNVAKAVTARGFKGYQDVLREAEDDSPCEDQREAEMEQIKETLSNLLKSIQGDTNGRTTKRDQKSG